MTEIQCMCPKFDRLEGSAVQIYVTLFLEATGVDENTDKTYYVCKICGRPWTQETIDGKPFLMRMDTEFNV